MSIDKEKLDEFEEKIEKEKAGAVVEMLPRNCDENVAIGLSVAVDAVRDGEEAVAKAALEVVIDELDDE